jgi:hypothetical protein
MSCLQEHRRGHVLNGSQGCPQRDSEKDGEVMYVDINDIWLLRVSREHVVTGKLGYS